MPISAGDLSGLYQNAGTDAPVVLIVPGSGPTDLNGNNTMGIESNMYLQLANGLAANGISSVRVDKRGMFSSAGAGDPNDVTVERYALDYQSWVAAVRAETGQDCVYLLGHSEGATMVSAAAIDANDVCGLILVAGPGRPLGVVLREQLKANPANFLINKEAFAAIEQLERGERVDTENMNPALKPLFYPAVQGFLISMMTNDPTELAARADKPALILQGETDIQVSVADAEILAEATGGKLVILDGINHILKTAPKSRMANMKTYSNPDLPISEEAVDAIADFVLAGN